MCWQGHAPGAHTPGPASPAWCVWGGGMAGRQGERQTGRKAGKQGGRQAGRQQGERQAGRQALKHTVNNTGIHDGMWTHAGTDTQHVCQSKTGTGTPPKKTPAPTPLPLLTSLDCRCRRAVLSNPISLSVHLHNTAETTRQTAAVSSSQAAQARFATPHKHTNSLSTARWPQPHHHTQPYEAY